MPPKAAFTRSENEENLARSSYSRLQNIFQIPAPIRSLFESVPYITYPSNDLPSRSPKQSKLPSLYVFGREEDVKRGRPSFNPSCLRWQTFLKIAGIPHQLISSNNHASPTGILPFLIPAYSNTSDTQTPIPSTNLPKYAKQIGHEVPEPTSMRYEAYQSVIDTRIRSAWLYSLYLNPQNFAAVAVPLYIAPTTSSGIVNWALASQLRAAAETELLKTSVKIDADDLYAEAEKAFEALSILLGENEWFMPCDGSDEVEPTLFDASVFAYTHLLLDEDLAWKDKKLVRCVTKRRNLVEHRDRLYRKYWGDR